MFECCYCYDNQESQAANLLPAPEGVLPMGMDTHRSQTC